MKLSIVTINRNNASGLEKTMRSVAAQSFKEIEYVVVDGASTDGSTEVIMGLQQDFSYLKWVSEHDEGIYDAMNKGIKMASGDYIQILNSGDCLAHEKVTELMLAALVRSCYPSILYGNMIKCFPDGHKIADKGFAGRDITLLDMYEGTLNHNPVYIRRKLFDKYGYYDESLKIVSDWKWYTQAIIFGDEKPAYVDLDVTLFDMTGVSESNKSFRDEEKRGELLKLIRTPILKDYDNWAIGIDMLKRLKRHPLAYDVVWFIERCMFKMEKWKSRRERIQVNR